jgi:hypothetical protein
MSDLPNVATLITNEETDYRAPTSESMLQKMGSSINYILDKMDLEPVGTVEVSFFTEAQFQAIRGAGWILCDGRSVAGTRYADITGNSVVPDLRGMFLRAKSHARSDGFQDPAGDQPLGTYEVDDNRSHNHTFQVSPGGGFIPCSIDIGAGLQAANGTDKYNVHDFGPAWTLTIHSAGSESVPRNITVNYFIRVDP